MELQLEKIMQERGLNDSQVSHLTYFVDTEKERGLTRATIGAILEHQSPSGRSIKLLCLALKVSPNQLLGWGK